MPMDYHTPLRPPYPKKSRYHDENTAPATPNVTLRATNLMTPPPSLNPPTISHRPPLHLTKVWSNGYLKNPHKPLSYSPYTPTKRAGKSKGIKSFAFPVQFRLQPKQSPTPQQWNELAKEKGILKDGEELRDFQIEGANTVLERTRDLCVVAPTGSGKSMLWILPLLVQRFGISLVIVPYTSLGYQGEKRHNKSAIPCTFLHSGSYSDELLESLAIGGEARVIYACVEMIEHPSIAHLLHSESFRAQLSGVYIDEAHVVHESLTWRPAYSRLHILRTLLGTDIPLIAISATLPLSYRTSLQHYAGIRNGYHLINLGNFRPELSVVIKEMKHAASSFVDLSFVIPSNATAHTLPSTIIYCDDLETLTSMFWWARSRLISLGLPDYLIDILHAGLSDEHQTVCIDDFTAGRSKILLGSEKIGAGMDFPNVTLVVQYRCRGLSLVRWEQRRGRGARRMGMTAVGVLLVESSMANLEGSTGTKSTAAEDPGMVELARSSSTLEQCIELISDKWLENPSRHAGSHQPCVTRCSNCNPHLHFETQYHWVMETLNIHKARVNGTLSDKEKESIFKALCLWRVKLWEEEWKDDWPRYGPDYLVSDHALREISNAALTISDVEDIDSLAQIPHLDDIAPSLLKHLGSTILSVCSANIAQAACLLSPINSTSPSSGPQVATTYPSITWTAPACFE